MATMLVIDDHEATCKFIQHVCRTHGIECLSAATAEAGLALIRQYQPSVIFIDLHLSGGINGWEAIRRIKNDPLLKDCIIITISASDYLDSATEAGSDGYLFKPFNVQQLKQILQKYSSSEN
jgi:CheY-like chemotaxis protein